MKEYGLNLMRKRPACVLALLLIELLSIKRAGATQYEGQSKTAQPLTNPQTIGMRTLDGGALIEEPPEIKQNTHGWCGVLWLDGYRVTVTPNTKMLTAPASTSFRYWNMGGFHVHAKLHGKFVNDSVLSSLLKPNTWATYHGTRESDGTITATQLRLWPNQINSRKEKFLRMFAAKIEKPSYIKHTPGNIQYEHGDPIQILPEQSVQDYVSHLGMELVPQYQKKLSVTDPTRINFHFYVIHPFTDKPGSHLVETNGELPSFGVFTGSHYTYNSPKRNTIVESLIAMPNGVVLIPDVALARIYSKSQLAALLSYAITSIVQEQAYLAWPYITSPHARRFNVHPSSIYAFSYWQNEQVLRIGIRQMYLAGYDIREAPYAWAVAQRKTVNNPVIDSKNPDKEIPWYATYAFNYISRYYKEVDYSKLKRGEKEYQQFLRELYKADPSLKRSETKH